MTKSKKDREEKPAAEEVSSIEKEIPIGDGETTPGAEPEAEPVIDELEQLRAKVAELEDQKLRALADMDNHRKRMARQFETVVRTANDRLLGEILDVVDNLDRAVDHAAENGDGENSSQAGLLEGTTMIRQQMLDLLARYEVRPIEVVGRPFDAAYHEALMQVVSDEYDEGMVVSEIRKGYLIGDRVLRHARVTVSKADEAESEAEE